MERATLLVPSRHGTLDRYGYRTLYPLVHPRVPHSCTLTSSVAQPGAPAMTAPRDLRHRWERRWDIPWSILTVGNYPDWYQPRGEAVIRFFWRCRSCGKDQP